MKKIRTGNDIHLTWTITKNDQVTQSDPLDLTGAEVLLIDSFNHPAAFNYEIGSIDSATTQVVGTFYGKDQTTQGKYRLLLVKNRGQENMITLDYADAFILTCVSRFGIIEGNDESTVTVATVELESTVNSYNGSPDMMAYYTKDEIDAMFAEYYGLLTGHTSNNSIHVSNFDRQFWNDKVGNTAFRNHVNDNNLHVTAAKQAKWNTVSDKVDEDDFYAFEQYTSENFRTVNLTLSGKSDDSAVVHKSGDEWINGEKTFNNATFFNNTVTLAEPSILRHDDLELFYWIQDSRNNTLQDALDNKQDVLTFDYTPTSGSTNPVTSNGIWQAIQNAGGGAPIRYVADYVLSPTGHTETEDIYCGHVSYSFKFEDKPYYDELSSLVFKEGEAGEMMMIPMYLPFDVVVPEITLENMEEILYDDEFLKYYPLESFSTEWPDVVAYPYLPYGIFCDNVIPAYTPFFVRGTSGITYTIEATNTVLKAADERRINYLGQVAYGTLGTWKARSFNKLVVCQYTFDWELQQNEEYDGEEYYEGDKIHTIFPLELLETAPPYSIVFEYDANALINGRIMIDDQSVTPEKLVMDTTPTSGSSNPVTSNGIWQALQNVGTDLNLENGTGTDSIMSVASYVNAENINEVGGTGDVGLGRGLWLGVQEGNVAIGGMIENRITVFSGSNYNYTITISGTTTNNNSQYGCWGRALVGNLVNYPLYDAMGHKAANILSATLDENDLNKIHITTDSAITNSTYINFGNVSGQLSKNNTLVGPANINGSTTGNNTLLGAYNYAWGIGGYSLIGGALNASNVHQSVLLGCANVAIGLDNQKGGYNTLVGGGNVLAPTRETCKGNKNINYNTLLGYHNFVLTENANATNNANYTTLVGVGNTHNHRGNNQPVDVFGTNNVTGHFRGTVVGQTNKTYGTEHYFIFGHELCGNPSNTQGMVADNNITIIGCENEPYSNKTKFVLATGDYLVYETPSSHIKHNSLVVEAEGTNPRQPTGWTMTINDTVKYKDLTEVEGATVIESSDSGVGGYNANIDTQYFVFKDFHYIKPKVGQIIKVSASGQNVIGSGILSDSQTQSIIYSTSGDTYYKVTSENVNLFNNAVAAAEVNVAGYTPSDATITIKVYDTVESLSTKLNEVITTIGDINTILTQVNGGN